MIMLVATFEEFFNSVVNSIAIGMGLGLGSAIGSYLGTRAFVKNLERAERIARRKKTNDEISEKHRPDVQDS